MNIARPNSPRPEQRTLAVSGQPAFAFDRRWHWASLAFLLLSTLVRLKQISGMELVPDEAYYWDWSRRLALGYYDQGPMVAYVIRLTTQLFGTNEFGVRIGILVASLGTLICTYLLARRLFSPVTGFLAVVLLGMSPLMELGSIIATYDPLLVFFWALAILFLERALFAETEKEQNRAWILTGVATGLGFLSKHTMLFLVPCLLLYLAISPLHRRWLLRPQPYLAFLITLLLYSGVFWWNAHNHWWTFLHVLFLTKKTSGTPLKRFGDLIGSQAVLVGPALFLGTVISGFKGLAMREETAGAQRSRFLACMGLPVLLIFCVISLKSKVQGNWPACAWMTTTILWAAWLTSWAGKSPASRWKAASLGGFTIALNLFLTLAVLWFPLRMRLGLRVDPDKDGSNTLFGWRALAAHVQQMRDEMEKAGHKVLITGSGYQYCAELAFYLPDHPETYDLFLHNRLDMYAAYSERLKSHMGEDVIFVNDVTGDDADLRQLFEEVTWDPPFTIYRPPLYPGPIRTVHFARCRHMRRWVGLDWAQGG